MLQISAALIFHKIYITIMKKIFFYEYRNEGKQELRKRVKNLMFHKNISKRIFMKKIWRNIYEKLYRCDEIKEVKKWAIEEVLRT